MANILRTDGNANAYLTADQTSAMKMALAGAVNSRSSRVGRASDRNASAKAATSRESPGTLQSACTAGYGIAQLMELGAERLFAEHKLVNLFPEWTEERFPLYAHYPSRHYLPAKTRVLVDFVASLVH